MTDHLKSSKKDKISLSLLKSEQWAAIELKDHQTLSKIPSALVEKIRIKWQGNIKLLQQKKPVEYEIDHQKILKKIEKKLQKKDIDLDLLNKTLQEIFQLEEDELSFIKKEDHQDEFIDLVSDENPTQKNLQQLFKFPQFFPDYKTQFADQIKKLAENKENEEDSIDKENIFFDLTQKRQAKPHQNLKTLILQERERRALENTAQSIETEEDLSTESVLFFQEENNSTSPEDKCSSEIDKRKSSHLLEKEALSFENHEKTDHKSTDASLQTSGNLLKAQSPELEQQDETLFIDDEDNSDYEAIDQKNTEKLPEVREEKSSPVSKTDSMSEDQQGFLKNQVMENVSRELETQKKETPASHHNKESLDHGNREIRSKVNMPEVKELEIQEKKSPTLSDTPPAISPENIIPIKTDTEQYPKIEIKHFSSSEYAQTENFAGACKIQNIPSWQEFKSQYKEIPQIIETKEEKNETEILEQQLDFLSSEQDTDQAIESHILDKETINDEEEKFVSEEEYLTNDLSSKTELETIKKSPSIREEPKITFPMPTENSDGLVSTQSIHTQEELSLLRQQEKKPKGFLASFIKRLNSDQKSESSPDTSAPTQPPFKGEQ